MAPDTPRNIPLKFVQRFLQGKTKKTAGVHVTPAVHALISSANALRDQREWLGAADLYRKALQSDAELIHIWVQLGHMLKEAGEPLDACNAYIEAFKLAPEDPALLGWIYGIAGRLPVDRRRELIHDIYRIQGRKPQDDVVPINPELSIGQAEIVFDVSDLMGYFARARRPTGIQRVQIEIINAALDRPDAAVRICCSIEESIHWVEISTALFRKVTALAVSGDKADEALWRDTIQDLNAALVFGGAFTFGSEARLINLGTSWWLQNYFLQIRNAKMTDGIEYIPFIHDLIPVLAPQHCVQGLVDDFNSWILGVFDHASRFLVNSISTKADLLKVAGLLGKKISDTDVTVVPLDGAFVLPGAQEPSSIIPRLELSGKQFILFVSTIESRKGHLVALRAWQRLLNDYQDATPYLVCVGNNGWLNQQFYELLSQDARLKERVILLSGLADTDLAYLYRTCQFTIYPSTYEGWGLPITEALTCGKVVVAADNSSLPQAGGRFAIYTRTGDDADLAEKIAHLSFDASARVSREQDIQAHYRPRSWSMIADQIVDTVNMTPGVPEIGADGVAPSILPAVWLDLRREHNRVIRKGAGLAERLRFGTGWASPDKLGCWIKESEAELRFKIPIAGENCRFIIKMYSKRGVRWSVLVNGKVADQGQQEMAGNIWAICPVGGNDQIISIVIKSSSMLDTDNVGPVLGVRGCMALDNGQAPSQEAIWAVLLDRLDLMEEFHIVDQGRNIN